MIGVVVKKSQIGLSGIGWAFMHRSFGAVVFIWLTIILKGPALAVEDETKTRICCGTGQSMIIWDEQLPDTSVRRVAQSSSYIWMAPPTRLVLISNDATPLGIV